MGINSVRLQLLFALLAIGLSAGGCSYVQPGETMLGPYFVDLTHHALEWDGVFDSQGIPMREYGEFGVQYQPVGIAHYALGHWDLWLETAQEDHKAEFLRMADWFVDNLVVHEEWGVWEYQFDFPGYQLVAPWPSAMSQGEGISVLCRAYELTDDPRYFNSASLALASFGVPIREGGVKYTDPHGFDWYEEYPSLDSPPHVLNGFVFALFGLYDSWVVSGDDEARHLFDEGVKTLVHHLERYDLGVWSSYSLTDLHGSSTHILRFVTDRRHPATALPVDTIALRSAFADGERTLTVLDVGSDGDTSGVEQGGTRLYYAPGYQDWGEPYSLEGRRVRNYEDRGGRWAHAPFAFIIDFQPGSCHELEVTYKDQSAKPVYIEMYADGVKYIRFWELDNEGAGGWKTETVQLPADLLLLRRATSLSYHTLHIEQLEVLHRLTGNRVFREHADRFRCYMNVVTAHSSWDDIVDGLNRLCE